MNIANVGKTVLTSTGTVSVPYLTNKKALVPGEELIVPFIARAKPAPNKRTHRQVASDEATKATCRYGQSSEKVCHWSSTHRSRGAWQIVEWLDVKELGAN